MFGGAEQKSRAGRQTVQSNVPVAFDATSQPRLTVAQKIIPPYGRTGSSAAGGLFAVAFAKVGSNFIKNVHRVKRGFAREAMEYHQVTKQITELLQKNNFWFETFEHEPVRTSEEAAKIRTGYSLHQGAKAMIVRVKISEKDRKFVMLVLPADLRFDNSKVKNIFHSKDIRLATEDEVSEITKGIQLGGVPPFGNLFGLEVIADPKLLQNDKIVFNAGDRRFSVAMKSQDYKALVNPQIRSII